MIIRGLWGIEIEPSKRYSFLSDASFKISMASLNSFDDLKRTSVFISFQGKEFILCSLIPEKIEQQVVDITCLEGEEIAFRSEGPNCIHLTGNYMSQYESDSEDESDELESVESVNNSTLEDGASINVKSRDEFVDELPQFSEVSDSSENDELEHDNQSFKMPIIYEYLDSLFTEDSNSAPNTPPSNKPKNGLNISHDKIIGTSQLTNKRKALESEISQPEGQGKDTYEELLDSDHDEREVIVIQSGQTSDIDSDIEGNSSSTESNYQSCDEEKKDKEEVNKNKVEEMKEEELEYMDQDIKDKEEDINDKEGEINDIEEEEISSKEEESDEEGHTSPNMKTILLEESTQKTDHNKNSSKATKKEPRVERNKVLPTSKATSTKMSKKAKAKAKSALIATTATAETKKASPKATPPPNTNSSTKKTQAKEKVEKRNSNNSSTKNAASKSNTYKTNPTNNNTKKGATVTKDTKNNTTPANKKVINDKTVKENTSKAAAKKLPQKASVKSSNSNTVNKTATSTEDNKSSIPKKNTKSNTNNVTLKKDIIENNANDISTKNRKAINNSKSQQSAVKPETIPVNRYPKRKRTPESDRMLELMASEDAKMAKNFPKRKRK